MIKVNIDELNGQLTKLSCAVADFEPYSKNFIKNTKNNIHSFNSDFISQITSTLSNMTDTKAPRLVKNFEKYITILDTVINKLEEADEKMAKKINSGK
ncbi:hypothetical protein [uncultured Clostridium sp.]|uniref:hypothetical protein n=1 Tax=uncultured Clostridium sp. TaxID=59620 RepID=UPI0025F4B169|nr:hypothetical protein [uncultured Clostridium sp.]